MTTVTVTEFRGRASEMLSRVEQGETLVVLRHGRPIAEVSPATPPDQHPPAWKRPALRLSSRGAGLASAILSERSREALP